MTPVTKVASEIRLEKLSLEYRAGGPGLLVIAPGDAGAYSDDGTQIVQCGGNITPQLPPGIITALEQLFTRIKAAWHDEYIDGQ